MPRANNIIMRSETSLATQDVPCSQGFTHRTAEGPEGRALALSLMRMRMSAKTVDHKSATPPTDPCS